MKEYIVETKKGEFLMSFKTANKKLESVLLKQFKKNKNINCYLKKESIDVK